MDRCSGNLSLMHSQMPVERMPAEFDAAMCCILSSYPLILILYNNVLFAQAPWLKCLQNITTVYRGKRQVLVHFEWYLKETKQVNDTNPLTRGQG